MSPQLQGMFLFSEFLELIASLLPFLPEVTVYCLCTYAFRLPQRRSEDLCGMPVSYTHHTNPSSLHHTYTTHTSTPHTPPHHTHLHTTHASTPHTPPHHTRLHTTHASTLHTSPHHTNPSSLHHTHTTHTYTTHASTPHTLPDHTHHT